MKEGKRSQSGFANRTVRKSKRDYSHRTFFETEGVFNKKQGYMLAVLILLIAGIPFGTWIFGYSPYFHSSHIDYVTKSDPATAIWQPFNNPNVFQYSNTNFVSYANNCAGTTRSCIAFDTGVLSGTAIALTKNPVGDLGTVAGKTLFIQNSYQYASVTNCCQFSDFGFYLTSNSTMPSGTYDPFTDISVQLLLDIHPTTNGNGNYFLYLHKQTATPQSLSQQDDGECNGGGSCYIGGSCSLSLATGVFLEEDIDLNYTGNTGAKNSQSQLFIGAGSCSGGTSNTFNTIIYPQFNLGNYYFGYFMKQKAGNNDLTTIDWLYSGSPTPAISSLVTGTIALPTNVDTGGFFGPLIRGLISLGVFIAQNLISFIEFLGTIISPLIAGFITVFSTIVTVVFNALGSIFGNGSLGTQMVNFIDNLASYFTQIFSNAIGWLASAVTFMASAISILAGFFDMSNSFIGLWQNLLSGIVSLLSGLNGFFQILLYFYNLNVFGFNILIIVMIALLCMAAILDWIHTDNPLAGFIAIILTFFLLYILQTSNSVLNVVATNASILQQYQTAWNNTLFFVKLSPVLFFGMFFEWASKIDGARQLHGSKEFMPNFQSLLKFYIMLTVDIFHGGYWFFENAFTIITRIITAVKGRWGPVEVAGTG